jgi:hypothetical protein
VSFFSSGPYSPPLGSQLAGVDPLTAQSDTEAAPADDWLATGWRRSDADTRSPVRPGRCSRAANSRTGRHRCCCCRRRSARRGVLGGAQLNRLLSSKYQEFAIAWLTVQETPLAF